MWIAYRRLFELSARERRVGCLGFNAQSDQLGPEALMKEALLQCKKYPCPYRSSRSSSTATPTLIWQLFVERYPPGVETRHK